MPIYMENATKYGIKEGQLVAESINTGTSAGNLDTGIDLPANSIIDYVYIKPTSAATVAGMSDRFYISNIVVINSMNGSDMTPQPLLATDLDSASNFLTQTAGIVITPRHADASNKSALGTTTSSIFLELSTGGSGPAGQGTVDVMVGYRTFDAS